MATITVTGRDWVEQLCREFSTATGWTLKFTPAEPGEESRIEDSLRGDSCCCWSAAIDDGQRRTGFLHLDLPDSPQRDRTYLATTQLANLFAQLLSRLATADRKLESRTQEVSTLMEIGRSVSQGIDVQGSLDQLLRAAVQLTGFWTSAFFLLSPSAQAMQLRATYHLDALQVPQPRRSFAQSPPDLEALHQGRAVLNAHEPDESRWLPADHAVGLCVPVLTEAGPIGTLWCFDRRQRRITDRDVHVLQSVAVQLAAALERAVLLKESQSQQRLMRELRAVSERQPSGSLSVLPLDWGVDVALRAASAHEVGGDLCEVFPAGAHRVIVTVGDAVGHSIPAAILMSVARGSLRTLLLDESADLLQTHLIVQRTNAALQSITQGEQFMTLVYGVVDCSSMTFSYTNAGHPNPLLIRQGHAVPLASHGLLLGITDDTTYDRSVLPLMPGDLLVFFTDGITEAMNRRNQIFRSEGIVAAIRNCTGDTAAEVADSIWQGVHQHSGRNNAADDRTLLVVRIRDE